MIRGARIFLFVSLSRWANRHSTLLQIGTAALLLFVGAFVNRLANGPKFFPTSVVLTDAEDKPVEREDLTEEAQACDAAVRSMLLAFAGETDQDDTGDLGFSARASATVESPYAIIPEECRTRIDEGFVISANGVSAQLKSARQNGDKIAISFVMTNNTNGTRRFAYSKSDPIQIKVSSGEVSSATVAGVSECTLACRSYDFSDATKIDSGRSVLVHVEAVLSGTESPQSATIIFPVVRWWSYRDTNQVVMLSFNDIPIGHTPGLVPVEAATIPDE